MSDVSTHWKIKAYWLILHDVKWHQGTNDRADSWHVSRRRCHSFCNSSTPNQFKIFTCTSKDSCRYGCGKDPSSGQNNTASRKPNPKSKNNSVPKLTNLRLRFQERILLQGQITASINSLVAPTSETIFCYTCMLSKKNASTSPNIIFHWFSKLSK